MPHEDDAKSPKIPISVTLLRLLEEDKKARQAGAVPPPLLRNRFIESAEQREYATWDFSLPSLVSDPYNIIVKNRQSKSTDESKTEESKSEGAVDDYIELKTDDEDDDIEKQSKSDDDCRQIRIRRSHICRRSAWNASRRRPYIATLAESMDMFRARFWSRWSMVKQVLQAHRAHVMVAGGAVCAELLGYDPKAFRNKPHDLDLFLHSLNDTPGDDFNLMVYADRLSVMIQQALMLHWTANVTEGDDIDIWRRTQCLYDIDKCPIVMERSPHVTTIFYGRDPNMNRRIKIQIIHRVYASASEILHSFDLPASEFAFDGYDLLSTQLSTFCLFTGILPLDTEKQSPSFESRICKYMRRGWPIIVFSSHFNIDKVRQMTVVNVEKSTAQPTVATPVTTQSASASTSAIAHSQSSAPLITTPISVTSVPAADATSVQLTVPSPMTTSTAKTRLLDSHRRVQVKLPFFQFSCRVKRVTVERRPDVPQLIMICYKLVPHWPAPMQWEQNKIRSQNSVGFRDCAGWTKRSTYYSVNIGKVVSEFFSDGLTTNTSSKSVASPPAGHENDTHASSSGLQTIALSSTSEETKNPIQPSSSSSNTSLSQYTSAVKVIKKEDAKLPTRSDVEYKSARKAHSTMWDDYIRAKSFYGLQFRPGADFGDMTLWKNVVDLCKRAATWTCLADIRQQAQHDIDNTNEYSEWNSRMSGFRERDFKLHQWTRLDCLHRQVHTALQCIGSQGNKPMYDILHQYLCNEANCGSCSSPAILVHDAKNMECGLPVLSIFKEWRLPMNLDIPATEIKSHRPPPFDNFEWLSAMKSERVSESGGFGGARVGPGGRRVRKKKFNVISGAGRYGWKRSVQDVMNVIQATGVDMRQQAMSHPTNLMDVYSKFYTVVDARSLFTRITQLRIHNQDPRNIRLANRLQGVSCYWQGYTIMCMLQYMFRSQQSTFPPWKRRLPGESLNGSFLPTPCKSEHWYGDYYV